MEDTAILTGLAAAPIITALVAVLRSAIGFADRFMALVTVVVALTWVSGSAAAAGELTYSTPFLGVVVGLAASGLYTVAKPPPPPATDDDSD